MMSKRARRRAKSRRAADARAYRKRLVAMASRLTPARLDVVMDHLGAAAALLVQAATHAAEARRRVIAGVIAGKTSVRTTGVSL